MLLARAGVVRLAWEDRIGETIDPSVILPAVGQGALGIEVRDDDSRVRNYVRALEHEPTMRATTAERALLRRLEGGYQIPIGTYGRITKNAAGARQLVLDAMVGSLDGHTIVRGTTSGEPARAQYLGESLADTLLRGGADNILLAIRSSAGTAS